MLPASSGPNARAGFIAAPVIGPPTKTSIVIVSPIARPAIALNAPRSSTAVAHTAQTRKNVMITSSRNAFPSVMCGLGAGAVSFTASCVKKYRRRNAAQTAPSSWKNQ